MFIQIGTLAFKYRISFSPDLLFYNSLSSSTCIYVKSVKKKSDARLHLRENQQSNNTILFCSDFPFFSALFSDRSSHQFDFNTIHLHHTPR